MSVDGTWPVVMQSPAGAQNITLVLQAEGATLTGTMMAPATPEPTPITDGTVDGDQLAWKVAITQPMPVTLEFTATVTGDGISGSAKFGAYGEGAFEGTRS